MHDHILGTLLCRLKRPGENWKRHHQSHRTSTSPTLAERAVPHSVHQDGHEVSKNFDRTEMPDEDGRHHTALKSRDHHDGVHHRGQGEDRAGA